MFLFTYFILKSFHLKILAKHVLKRFLHKYTKSRFILMPMEVSNTILCASLQFHALNQMLDILFQKNIIYNELGMKKTNINLFSSIISCPPPPPFSPEKRKLSYYQVICLIKIMHLLCAFNDFILVYVIGKLFYNVPLYYLFISYCNYL